MMINTNAIIKNMNIRGVEKKTSRAGKEYAIVRAEDETGRLQELCDRDAERWSYYKRDTVMDITVHISVGRFTSIEIVDAKIVK